jgi:anionic cell wall polymer biosynthesis LytR-Cps2A-Psr (LCP) family protein
MAKKGVKLGATYVIALIATFLIFGFIGVVYVNMLTGDDGAESEQRPVDVSSEYAPSSSESRTVLAVVELGETQNETCFMLMRFLPENSETIFLPLPANMFGMANDGSETNLYRLYRDGSASAVKTAINDTFGVTVDKYIIFNSESFQSFCGLFGSTDYDIPYNIDNPDGTIILAGNNYLDQNTMRSLLTYTGYKGGEEERARRFAEIMTAMLNKELTSSFTPLMDAAFTDIVNSGADTDISRLDYDDSKEALSYTLNHTDRFCHQILSSGSLTEAGNYIVDPAFIEAVATWFEVQPE